MVLLELVFRVGRGVQVLGDPRRYKMLCGLVAGSSSCSS